MIYNDPAQITAATGELDSAFTKFDAYLGSLETTISKRSEELDADLKHRLAGTEPEGRELLRKALAQPNQKVISDLRRSLVASSEEGRSEHLKKAHEFAQALDLTAEMNSTPLQMLSSSHLGSERRTEIQKQLDGAGPMELQSAMRRFELEGDLEGAAAALIILDRAPKGKYKGLETTPAEYASKLLGEKHQQIQNAIAEARIRVEAILARERTFLQGKPNSIDQIKIGLLQRQLPANKQVAQDNFRVDIADILKKNRERNAANPANKIAKQSN